jgi:hypothetical protein
LDVDPYLNKSKLYIEINKNIHTQKKKKQFSTYLEQVWIIHRVGSNYKIETLVFGSDYMMKIEVKLELPKGAWKADTVENEIP